MSDPSVPFDGNILARLGTSTGIVTKIESSFNISVWLPNCRRPSVKDRDEDPRESYKSSLSTPPIDNRVVGYRTLLPVCTVDNEHYFFIASNPFYVLPVLAVYPKESNPLAISMAFDGFGANNRSATGTFSSKAHCCSSSKIPWTITDSCIKYDVDGTLPHRWMRISSSSNSTDNMAVAS